MLLRTFPGRTLEELDEMDWGRWQRAVEAQMHLDVERVRERILAKEIKASQVPRAVADMILEHDDLVGDYEDDGDDDLIDDDGVWIEVDEDASIEDEDDGG
jgi:hypothetical protein